MRVVVGVIAALLTLGLAAFGVVAAQKAEGPASLIALAQHVMSSGQTTNAAAPAAAAPSPVTPRPAPAPVIRDSETATPLGAPAAAPEPIRVAQNVPQNATASALAAAAPTPAAPAPTPAAANSGGAAAPTALPPCSNPNALGLSRIVQIDASGGPAFGTEHFKQYDFLRDKEVVLTFDDGPWPENTPMVLKALQDNCIRATFFEIGEHATWAPQLSKALVEAGMTVGSHTWSHKDLAKNPYAQDIEQAKQAIEMGESAVHTATGGHEAPFFRFPDLQMPPELIAYLGTRNIATFSADIDTFDFKIRKPEEVIKSVMTKLAKNGKGMLLMHDFQRATAQAMPELLRQLKAAGYKVVHMVPKAQVTTLAQYDEMVRAQDKFSSTNNTRPESSVIQTISQ